MEAHPAMAGVVEKLRIDERELEAAGRTSSPSKVDFGTLPS